MQLLLAACVAPLLGQQRQVVIEPTAIGVIQSTIEADLLANDTATVENTVYILKRGERYAYETQYRVFHDLTIMAEEGDGPRPEIVPVPPATGEAPRFIRPETSDLTIVGLEIGQKDANGQHTDNAPIRIIGNGARVQIEDCILDGQRFENVRTGGVNQRVFLINNIILNNFQQDNWYKSGGLWFQNGNPVDTMVMRDNTYANNPARFTHSINGAAINYLELTNNTIVNVGGMDELGFYGRALNTPVVDLGIARNLVVEENIFYNLGWMGYENDTAYVGKVAVFNIYTDSLESWSFKNNNIYTEDALLAGTPDTALQIPMLTANLDSFMNEQSTTMTGEEYFMSLNISEELTFENAPMSIDLLADAKMRRWADPDTAFKQILRLDSIPYDQISYRYSTDAMSYTAGEGGSLLGSRRWFGGVTSLPNYTRSEEIAISASPNPARNFTVVNVTLRKAADIQIHLHDFSGRQLAVRNFGRVPAGDSQPLRLDDLGLPPGTYVYTVVANEGGRQLGTSRRLVIQ
jgi:hypothetical protein